MRLDTQGQAEQVAAGEGAAPTMAPEVDTTRLAPEPRAGSALPAEPPKGAEECNVCVAVHVRPLIHEEIIQECKETISVTPNSPQVRIIAPAFGPLDPHAF